MPAAESVRCRWEGVFPAMVTQFRQDQSLDLAGTARHLERLIQSGIQGIVVCGSLGESQTLTADERRQLVVTAVATAAGRIPVVAGIAALSTSQACDQIRAAEEAGAAGLMVMPAMVYRADLREAVQFYRRVAKAVRTSWMLYNNPIAYPVDATPELLHQLVDLDNLLAIKESSGNTRRIVEIRQRCGDRFQMFVGVDDLILESSILGIDGWIAGAGAAFPEENQRLWELLRAREWDTARSLYEWFAPLMKLDTHVKFVQYIKLAIQETGLGTEWVREPRLPLAGAEREEALAIIRRTIATRPSK